MRKLFISLFLIFALAVLAIPQTTKGPFVAKGQGVVRRAAAGGAGTPYILTETIGTPRNDFSGCVGFKFTATANNTVVALGRWMISGNSGTHLLALVQDTGGGNGTLLQSCSVNLSGGTPAAYNYCTITSQAITDTTVYFVLSEETNTGDQWYDDNTTLDSTTSGIGTLGGSWLSNTGCTSGFSGPQGGAPLSYVPPNFKVQ